MISKKKRLFCLALLGALTCSASQAGAAADDQLEEFNLDQIVVTANRLPQTNFDAHANVNVVTRKDIEENHYQTVSAAPGARRHHPEPKRHRRELFGGLSLHQRHQPCGRAHRRAARQHEWLDVQRLSAVGNQQYGRHRAHRSLEGIGFHPLRIGRGGRRHQYHHPQTEKRRSIDEGFRGLRQLR